MADLPTGTVTLLFTDIEASTRLLQRLGPADYGRLLFEHQRLMRAAIAACAGVEIKTEGDSFFAIFRGAADAIKAAVQAQRALRGWDWPEKSSVAVRMGIHTGDVALIEDEYVGLAIHRAARIAAAAHGGQVLLSEPTRALVGEALPDGVRTMDLGEHRLKDLEHPEHVFQLAIDGLPADFPPIRALSTRFDLLPPETTTFVGRGRELQLGRELLSGTRLLTLTGPGGTGKTRLSLRLALDVADDFADGVAFVQLAPISDPELVAPTIRQVLGLGEEVGRTPLDTLTERLQRRHALLVLDNFEQLLPAAPVVAALLEGTERLKIAVTSRAALHLTGEQEFPVPPLALPASTDIGDLAALSQSESVALFLQRARTVRPDFQLTSANAAAIVEICARLDGLPLAIELAASRIKLLPPQALLSRLERRLDLLQSTAADRTDRQRTLRGAIDWSYSLLGPEEQALFRRLAVFIGGWRLEDAEPVVGAAGLIEVDVLEGLSRLVDHSLVREVGEGDEPRFAMLVTIREFGFEQLSASGELDVTAFAHALRFAALAGDAEPHLTAGREWTDRLEREHANIRAALAWLAEHEIERALMMAGSLWRFWHLRGHLREGTALLADQLQRPGATEGTLARARALIGLAGLVYWQTDYEAARRSYKEALRIAQSAGDDSLQMEILYSLAYVQAIEGDWDGSIRSFSESKAMYEGKSAALGVAWALMGIGMVNHLRGQHAESLPILAQAESQFRQLNNSFGLRNTLSNLGRALMHLGLVDESRRVIREYLEKSHADNDPTSLSTALIDAASLEAIDGDPERSARLIGAAQRIIEESGGQPPPQLMNRIEPLPILRERLPTSTLTALIGEGHAMNTEEAVGLALEPEVAHPEGLSAGGPPTA